ncbi:MAG: HAD-IIIA family hydrolase [Deltaproteobacteria bacterium]|nr:HAD-IIIA family hydrolase [Deltaproteobacteria bacterium]
MRETDKIPPAVLARLRALKALIMDVDGVLTDGGITIDDQGRESKTFHVRDGHGLKLLRRTGFQLALLTGRYSRVVELRAAELGIETVYQKALDKVAAYEEIRERFGLEDRQIAYLGDDLVDIPVMRRVGFAATVADGIEAMDQVAHWRTSRPGGRGAVRELCELILRTQGTWEQVTGRYFG